MKDQELEDTEREIIEELYGIGYENLDKASNFYLDRSEYASSSRLRKIINLLKKLGGEK